MSMSSKGLGKGLSALMAEDYSHETFDPAVAANGNDSITTMPIRALTAGKYQPRSYFNDDALKELSDSIKRNGVMQPLLIRPLVEPRGGADYEIIAGERRWRASQMAGLTDVPVLVRDIDDKKALELALIENIQRQDLNALEEADGYQQLMDSFNYTQEELSGIVGKSRSHVANSLRLLHLPKRLRNALNDNDISAGHARALLKAEDPESLLYTVLGDGLNVRQTEALVRKEAGRDEQPPTRSLTKRSTSHTRPAQGDALILVPEDQKDPDIVALQDALSEQIGVPVTISDVDERGHVVMSYNTLAELDVILSRIGGGS